MKHTYDEEKLCLNINLDEEIDMNSCKTLRTVIDGYIMRYQPRECIIDLKQVKFMDSSGIGLILGRYNLMKLMNSKLVIANPSYNIKRIIELSSIGKEISLRGE
jgi:stage II sporulation protein AA (anti-sigma F factor antagonist)